MPVRPAVINGVCPVLETPFHPDGSVDHEGFERLIDHVLAAGVRSVMFPGFASEFYKLTDEERTALTRLLLDKTRNIEGFTAIISVPDHATDRALERARQAVDGGAGAINILPPYFLSPSSSQVREHLLTVLTAVAPIPVVLQYAPGQTGSSLDAHAIVALADAAENLVQIKVESTQPGRWITELAAMQSPLTSVLGSAGVQLPDAWRRGAVGVQPGSSFVELYLAEWQLWRDGQAQQAEALHTRMLPYLSYWMQAVELIIAAEKEISVRRGIFRSAFCRGPAYTLDSFELAMVDQFMAEFSDFF